MPFLLILGSGKRVRRARDENQRKGRFQHLMFQLVPFVSPLCTLLFLQEIVFFFLLLSSIWHVYELVALSICFCMLCCTLVYGLKVESSSVFLGVQACFCMVPALRWRRLGSRPRREFLWDPVR